MDSATTLSSVALAAAGGGFATLCSFLASRWLKGADFRHEEEKLLSVAQLSDAQDIRRTYQSIIVSLQARIKESEESSETLWKKFRELQDALYRCEDINRTDAAKISKLERENQSQATRIRTLELRLPGIDPDYDAT